MLTVVGAHPVPAGAAAEPSVRKTCKAAETAAAERRRAQEIADEPAFLRAGKKFAAIERRAPDDLPRDLTTQLRLVSRTMANPPERPVVLRETRLFAARLAHGLTGVMLACDRAGVRVTIEY